MISASCNVRSLSYILVRAVDDSDDDDETMRQCNPAVVHCGGARYQHFDMFFYIPGYSQHRVVAAVGPVNRTPPLSVSYCLRGLRVTVPITVQ